MNVIYIDMDGVVADFDTYVEGVLGREIGWGTTSDLSDEEWKKLASVENLYFKLPLMPDATKLIAYIKSLNTRFHVEFLTAIPRRTTIPSAQADKQAWITKYFPGMKMNIGPYSHDKQKWCTPGDILIDDRPSNIAEWTAAGGIAVYHTGDVDATIKYINRTLV